MQGLSEEGRQTVADIAKRHGFSTEAAGEVLSALAAGGGRQAQFNHPDLGGMGQWSQGGMIMIGDMFNQALKARVDALCRDLAEALKTSSPFASAPAGSSGSRWPADLGSPSSTGSQNDMHYAVFPGSRRLAVEQGGRTTIYDTGDHHIGGVSQQQSGDQSLRFTSQLGPVDLSQLKVVTQPGSADDPPPLPSAGKAAAGPEQSPPTQASRAGDPGDGGAEICARIERLAELHSRGILTAEEFAAKKAELLARL